MLTTSPVISSPSNNGSPRSFGMQYGPSTRSPHQHQGASRRQGALPRRQTSMSNSSQPESPVVAGSMISSPKSQASQQKTSPAKTAASAAHRCVSSTSGNTKDAAALQQTSNVSNLSSTREGARVPIQQAPSTPGPRPLNDTQSQQNTGEVAALPASTTMSPSKRSKPADSDDDGGPGSAAGPSTRPAQRPRQSASPPKRLSVQYERCSVEDMAILISNMLVELIETNDNIPLRSGSLTRFHSRTAPGISVQDYLFRLARHATLTPPLLLSMVYYIDRLCAQYPQFTINTLTVHRFLITAATVAAKGLSDSFWNNTTYAKVGGVRVQELNLLELEFLHRVEWRIVPNPEVLVAYYKGLIERHPGYVLDSSEQEQTIATAANVGGEDDNPNSEDEDGGEDDELGDSDSDDLSDESAEPAASMAESAPG